MKKLISALTVSVLSVAAASVNMPLSIISAEDDMPVLHEITAVESESSESGLTSVEYYDEDGNEFTPNLIPKRMARAGGLPSKYDLRDYGYVTDVRSQGTTKSCWAHATLAAIESNMIMTGMADRNIDLSESHLVWFGNCQYSTDPKDFLYHEGIFNGIGGYDIGSNYTVSRAALASWKGIQLEENFPDVDSRPEIPEEYRYTSYGYLSNSDTIDKNDMDSIKRHLMSTGALMASYYENESAYYSASTYAQYCPDEDTGTDHAITIVGWDDSFSASNFNTRPAGNGAWICKNSWGDDWGDNGYFYISYYDKSFSSISSFEVVPTDKYDNIYQYDGEHYMDLHYGTGISGANIFEFTEEDEVMKAVSFYTTNASVPYKISIYTDVKKGRPTSGELAYTQEGTADYGGYHVIDLDKSVSINKNSLVSVVVTFMKNGEFMAIDQKSSTENSSFTTSYNVNTGSFGQWLPPVADGKQYDVCIKAFTKSGVLIDSDNFPDDTFRNYVSYYFDSDGNGLLSESEIKSVTKIDVENMGVSSLKGIEYFTELTYLECSGNSLVSVDITKNEKIKYFYADNLLRTMGSVRCDKFSDLGIDTSKITNITGGYISGGVIVPESSKITYKYNCGNGFIGTFNIQANYINHTMQNPVEYSNSDHISSCKICGLSEKSAHTFGSFTYTETQHSRDCKECGYTETHKNIWVDNGTSHSFTCSECSAEKEESHSYSEWSDNGSGYHTRKCSVCGNTEKVKHTYDDWTKDDSKSHSRICSVCGSIETTEHNFSEWTENSGLKEYHLRKCSDCGYSETNTHTYKWTDSDEKYHYGECTECGNTVKKNHKYGEWQDKDKNSHSRECSECGYIQTAEHNFSEWVLDMQYAINSHECTECKGRYSNSVSYKRGDMNSDGRIDVFDMILFRRAYVYGFEKNTDILPADFNGDKQFTVADILALNKFILNIKD